MNKGTARPGRPSQPRPSEYTHPGPLSFLSPSAKHRARKSGWTERPGSCVSCRLASPGLVSFLLDFGEIAQTGPGRPREL